MYVDGRATVAAADLSRSDVAVAFPEAGDAHGFSVTTEVPPGAHTVCLYLIDVDQGSQHTPLGCRAVSTQVALPVGSVDWVSADGGTVSVGGWALDPDSSAVSSSVHVYVDGVGAVV
ncbi:hypothetical protein O2V63_20730, partial [Modestobacter sp. VKM Ac-2977]|nr:hypothetical protein [Modestobacter sp. VKM Ac-2977]